MSSNEEYLDSLLKSMEQKEAALEEMPTEAMPAEEAAVKEMPIEKTANHNIEELSLEELLADGSMLKELLANEPLPEQPLPEQPLPEEALPEEPLKQPLPEEPLKKELSPEALPPEDMSDMDLDALLESMNDNEDLAEIQNLFAKAENNEPVSDEGGELLMPEMDTDTKGSVEAETPRGKNKLFVQKKLKQFFSRKKKERKKKARETEAEKEQQTQQEIQQKTEQQIEEAQTIEPQMPDEDDIADISALLSSLENVGQESKLGSAGVDLFASADSEDELRQVAELLGDVASENPKKEETDWGDTLQESWEEALPDTLKEKEQGEAFQDIQEEPVEEISDKKEKNLFFKKKKREAKKKETKQGVFARILQFLTEEDEDEQEENTLSELAGGVETVGVTSDENREVLAQLDKEDKNGKKKKKKRKKGDQKNSTADEDDQDEKEEPQKNKKKVKKEKKLKEPKIIEDIATPKLSKKKVSATFLLAFTMMAAILVCCLFIPQLFELQEARTAYYEGDYEACYRALYGKKLSESDAIMYERSEFMMSLQRRLEAYDSYMAVNDELRALDALMQAVANQKELLKTAEAQGLTAEAESSYQEILNMLKERYQLGEEEALKICAYKQDVLYTLHLKAIVAGEEFVCPDFLQENGEGKEERQPEEEHSSAPLEDVLPAEEELAETEFEEGITEP